MKREFNKDTKLTYYYDHVFSMTDGRWHDMSALSDDAITDLTDALNDDCEGYVYSGEQVKQAAWRVFESHIEAFLEDFDHFIDKFRHEHSAQWERYLGAPEIDVAEEQRLAHGDYLYDVSRGN